MIDRDALVKRLQFTIDDGTLRERDGGCRTATDHEIALWNILTAPAEAPVAWISAKDLAAFRDSGYTEIATITSVGSLHCTEPLYAAPLPQSAPVSREEMVWVGYAQELPPNYQGKILLIDTQLPPDEIHDTGKPMYRLYRGSTNVRSLATHPAEPAGKGE